MSNPTTALFTVAQTRRIESQAMALPGHAAWLLMQRAAAAAFATIRARWPEARRLLVVCGSGNNGGDGYVVATLARAAGLDARVVQVGAQPTRAPAQQAVAGWHATGAPVVDYSGGGLDDADLIVDALFGIGLDRAPSGLAAEAIVAMNHHAAPRFSLDVPSGLNADTGSLPGVCVQADATLAFIAWKRGLWTGVAARVCGQRALAGLDLPEAAFDGVARDARLLHEHELARMLPRRARDAHKGANGHVLVVGGDLGFGGAVIIAAQAALRAGAGLVSVATRAQHVAPLLARMPECMARAVDQSDELVPLLARADVIVLGPGLGLGDWSIALAEHAIRAGKPVVLDADALNLLAAGRIAAPAHGVITPHPGEAARLLGSDTDAIACDRFVAARSLARRYMVTTVLKGAGSLVATVDGEVAVCPYGNPGMASGGMGDALSGIIAALIAQGLTLADAARQGVLAHALAADHAARDGERGLLASDVIDGLRRVLNR